MIRRFAIVCILILLSLSSVYTQTKDEGSTENSTKKTTQITIKKAQKTSSKKDTVTGNSIIVLTGGVEISVVSGDTESVVTANLVNYDRERSMLYAEGSVTLQKKKGSVTQETLTADSFLLNTDTLEGVFNNGSIVQLQSTAVNVPEGSTVHIYAEMFGRDNSGTITFKNGSLTLCEDENPHWQIKASRIWLLSGNEFAFANALLYIGRIPIMYLPFFYYPKDELLFNPAFGYRSREGYFVQTTTYIIGRKPLDTTNNEESFFDFLKETELKKQVRQGLFLHNLAEKETEVSQNYLKIFADYYTNLGGMIGTQGVFKPKSVITDLQFSVQLGFSRTLFPYTSSVGNQSVYLTVDPNTGTEYWDKSSFIGLKLPFRYATNFQMTLNYNPFKLSIAMPIYSDTYFKTDFLNRTENMDWINFLMENPVLTTSTNDSTTTSTEVTSFVWKVNASITPTLNILKPYVKTLNLTNLEFNLNFNSKANTLIDSTISNISPERKFFYPSTMTPAKATATISGSLFSWPLASSTSKAKDSEAKLNTNVVTTENLDNPFKNIPQNESDSDNAEFSDDAEPSDEVKELLPTIKVTVPAITVFKPFTYSLDYSISPQLDSLITYSSASDITLDTIKWDEFQQSYYKIQAPVTMTSTAGVFDSFIGVKNVFSFKPVFQRHPTISNTYYSETSRNQIVYNDYVAESRNVENTNAVSIKPFTFLPIVSKTALTWNTAFKLITTEFTGTAENPVWDYEKFKWDKEHVTTHNLNLSLSAEEGKFSQLLSIQANLPPLLDTYTGKLTLTFPYVTVSGDSGYKKKSFTDETWVFSPFNQSSTIKLFNSNLTITQSFKYDIEEGNPTSFQLGASGAGLTATYLMMYTNGYNYDEINGWKQDSEKTFKPYSLNFSYSKTASQINLWKDRLNLVPSLQSSLVFDLIRSTNSYFTISPGLTLKIYDFASLTFSSTSRNDVIFRYTQDLAGANLKIPGETNPWQDLIDSFNFGDEQKRSQSGFKLKSFSVKLEHYLHDWTLKSEFLIKPRLIKTTTPYHYDFSPYFSLSVVWKPMGSMKTTIVDEYGEIKLNPATTTSN